MVYQWICVMCVCGGELGKAGLICCHFVSLPQDQTCVLLMKNSSDIRTAPRGTEHGYETHVRPRLNTASVCVWERVWVKRRDCRVVFNFPRWRIITSRIWSFCSDLRIFNHSLSQILNSVFCPLSSQSLPHTHRHTHTHACTTPTAKPLIE